MLSCQHIKNLIPKLRTATFQEILSLLLIPLISEILLSYYQSPINITPTPKKDEDLSYWTPQIMNSFPIRSMIMIFCRLIYFLEIPKVSQKIRFGTVSLGKLSKTN